jgi:hypothetical protein
MLAVEDIFNAPRSVVEFMVIRQGLYFGFTLEPSLETWDERQIQKVALSSATTGARFVAETAVSIVLVFPCVAHARVDTTIIEHWFDFREQCKSTHCNILGFNV